jgi:hypothetical protein
MTRIEEAHEQLLAYRKVAPLGQRAVAQWIETHDDIEQEISHLKGETLGDVLIKLDVLCGRLAQASVCEGDLMIATSARRDLKRLMAQMTH